MRDLNKTYRTEQALHELDCDPAGFEWIDGSDADNSAVSFLRKGKEQSEFIAIICNFTPVARHNYRVGVPVGGFWNEVLNSDAPIYEGSGQGNFGGVEAAPVPYHGRLFSLNLTLPPLGILYLRSNSQNESMSRPDVLPSNGITF
jgi:1,4-alpha-glucan branching enzyme